MDFALPTPTVADRQCGSVWETNHDVDVYGRRIDGAVEHNYPHGVSVDTRDGGEHDFTYEEARRVALAMLAAVDEMEAMATVKGADMATNHWLERLAAARYIAPDDLQPPRFTATTRPHVERHAMPHSRLSTVGKDTR